MSDVIGACPRCGLNMAVCAGRCGPAGGIATLARQHVAAYQALQSRWLDRLPARIREQLMREQLSGSGRIFRLRNIAFDAYVYAKAQGADEEVARAAGDLLVDQFAKKLVGEES